MAEMRADRIVKQTGMAGKLNEIVEMGADRRAGTRVETLCGRAAQAGTRTVQCAATLLAMGSAQREAGPVVGHAYCYCG